MTAEQKITDIWERLRSPEATEKPTLAEVSAAVDEYETGLPPEERAAYDKHRNDLWTAVVTEMLTPERLKLYEKQVAINESDGGMTRERAQYEAFVAVLAQGAH